MSKLKKFFTDFRIIMALFVLVVAIFIVHSNPWNYGVTIRSVLPNSSAYLAGMRGPLATQPPMSRERIIMINNIPIRDINDFYSVVGNLSPNMSLLVKTNKAVYKLVTKPKIVRIPLNETVNRTVVKQVFNATLNKTINITEVVEVQKFKEEVVGTQDLGLRVYNAPKSNIKLGLDLQGGTRIILKAEEKNATPEEFQLTIDNLKQRINVYGLTDVVVREASDLSGNRYIIVEVAGASEEEVSELIEKQGKFEAKIGNETVFKGSDVKYVCMSADCSGIDPRQGCFKAKDNNYYCKFRFSVSLSPEAAQRQASITSALDVVSSESGDYLSKNIDFYLDGSLVDSLKISAELKGKPTSDIMITGFGSAPDEREALENALKNMKRLQTVLKTGSLPLKLQVVSKDAISPTLGRSFIKNTLVMGFFAFLAVILVLSFVYKKFSIIFPIIITGFAEILITVALLTLLNWNLDLAAIAGLIAAVGSGVDDQIVLTDEALRGERRKAFTWKQKFKNAFRIIIGSYLTTLFAMIPLLLAGAGVLRGFAITTIVGITVGVVVTRPAYARIIRIILSKE